MYKTLIAIVLALTLTGCAALLPYLVAAGQVAQWITAVVDQVDASSEHYFDNYPSPDLEAKVRKAIASTRSALAALNAAVAAAEASNDADVETAKAEVLRAYTELYSLLEQFGLLGANGELGLSPGETVDVPHPDAVGLRL